jgi:hypothetical protein
VGPIEARALAFLTLAPGTGEGLGLGLEGGLSEDILCVVCADYDEYFICERKEARGCKFSLGKRRKDPWVEVPRRGRKGVAGWADVESVV